VRRVVLAIDDPDLIPDEMDWEYDGMRGKVLINILGRPVKCMRCGFRGHRKFECEAPFCSVCRTVGHTRTSTCKRQKKSYAAAASGEAEERMDEDGVDAGDVSDDDDHQQDGNHQQQGSVTTTETAAEIPTTNGATATTAAEINSDGQDDQQQDCLEDLEAQAEPTVNW